MGAKRQARNLKVKNLGFILDSELSFEPHLCNRTKVVFGISLSSQTLMHACVKYRMYHCDALLSGQPTVKEDCKTQLGLNEDLKKHTLH